ncbi:hypothetical protein, partial [Kingella kingae]
AHIGQYWLRVFLKAGLVLNYGTANRV